jgi:hypothetical protein
MFSHISLECHDSRLLWKTSPPFPLHSLIWFHVINWLTSADDSVLKNHNSLILKFMLNRLIHPLKLLSFLHDYKWWLVRDSTFIKLYQYANTGDSRYTLFLCPRFSFSIMRSTSAYISSVPWTSARQPVSHEAPVGSLTSNLTYFICHLTMTTPVLRAFNIRRNATPVYNENLLQFRVLHWVALVLLVASEVAA